MSSLLFFCYGFLACGVYGLLAGSVGFLGAYVFVRRIYGSVFLSEFYEDAANSVLKCYQGRLGGHMRQGVQIALGLSMMYWGLEVSRFQILEGAAIPLTSPTFLTGLASFGRATQLELEKA